MCSARLTRKFRHVDLEAFGTEIFAKHGLPRVHAGYVSKSLVEANLRGQDGHGISRIGVYTKRLRAGIVNPAPNIELLKTAPAAILCDGDNGMGVVVGTYATIAAISLAKEQGVGIVGVKNSTHFGSSSRFVLQALRSDMISMIFTNSSPAMPPHGGARPFLGASPIAAGAPTGKQHPFVLDMATTVIARGKLRLAAQRGEAIAEGVGLDRQGRPTRDGMEAFHGVTLPFGGVKGAALSLMMEVMAGVFTGAAFGGRVSSLYNDFTTKQNVGHLMIVIRPDLFLPMAEFKDRMDELVMLMKSQPLAAGFEEILMVGEPETRCSEHRLVEGIPIQDDVVLALQEEGLACGVLFPPPLSY